jgi:general secretion pathway protein J
MRIEARKLIWTPAAHAPAGIRAFTLLEVLLALLVMAIVMVVVHSVFHSALTLRNRTDEAFADAIPLEHTLAVIRRDVANLTVPGGTLSGTIQTTPTTDNSSSLQHMGQQCGPTLYTASGALNDYDPWSEMRKVTYFLMPATNSLPGYELVRSVVRNLLPVNVEEYTDESLMSGVNELTFQFYDGNSWQDTWDSTTTTATTESNSIPLGVRVSLTLINAKGVVDQNPIELVIPIGVQPGTNYVVNASSSESTSGATE